MKKIDIHTKQKLGDNEEMYSKPICNELMMIYVFKNIGFPISKRQWKIIDDSFEEYWNNKIGIGGYFYWDEVVDYVFKIIELKLELLSYKKVETIINLMLNKIENDGGFMDL